MDESQRRDGRNPCRFFAFLILTVAAGCLPSATAHAAEPWADPDLPVNDGLLVWLDASREPAARQLEGLEPPKAGGELDRWHDASGNDRSVSQPHRESRPRWVTSGGGGEPAVRFGGRSFLFGEGRRAAPEAATVFVVFSPRRSAGTFDALVAWNRFGANDYQTGFNVDLGSKAADQWVGINVEGAGQAGERNLLKQPMPLGAWHVLAVRSSPGRDGTALFVDGRAQGTRDRAAGAMALDQFLVGARYNGTPPYAQQFLTGDVAEVLVYGRALSDEQRLRVETYLSAKHAALLKAADVTTTASGVREAPLEPVADPPPVQMLVPGFEVRELPVNLTNANNVAYAPDGRLFVAGYDGRLHVLRDTDGDGLEDSVKTFAPTVSDDYPLGMAYGDKGLYVLRRHRLVLHTDTDGDGVPDKEETAATGWRDPSLDNDPLYEHRRVDDALGLAVAPGGTVYVSIGAANFANAYLLDKEKRPHVDLAKRRGCVLRIRPSAGGGSGTPEIFATGVRFVMSMQFNRHGDLFATDQEGATWMPNGNPFDELLHLREGRHYGFPPRHPTYLPNVIDEPSVFDYAPQHESTCGFRFNEARTGWAAFGPASWDGDALVTGESRGKLFRTKLVKTPQGYVARNQLVGCLTTLPVDLTFSPKGEMVIAAHSGQPDWGSGPSGKGHLFKIRYTGGSDTPQPAVAWAAAPDETRVAFDRPLDDAQRKALTSAANASISAGRFAAAGDRFESLRPGYAVVNNIQQPAPRYAVPVASATVADDGRTLVLKNVPREAAMQYVLSLPSWLPASTNRGVLVQQPAVELAHDLSGVEATWTSSDNADHWTGWLPHADLQVSAELTRGSAAHDKLWALIRSKPGTLRLRGQLDLWQMLHPAVQPGSKLDYVPTVERVSLAWRGGDGGTLGLSTTDDAAHVEKSAPTSARLIAPAREGRWVPFELSLSTNGKNSPAELRITWHTEEDATERALPLRRFLVPWAKPLGGTVTRQNAPELAGGNWAAGRALFFDKNLGCARCHTTGGEGGKVAPDLSNLIHRDYASVMKDVRQPSAAINPDYLYYVVELTNRDTLSGIVAGASDTEVRLGDASGTITAVPRAKIKSMRTSKVSMMPEGLLDKLSAQQVRDLMTFLLTEPPALRRE